jgi:hypothetical protein
MQMLQYLSGTECTQEIKWYSNPGQVCPRIKLKNAYVEFSIRFKSFLLAI